MALFPLPHATRSAVFTALFNYIKATPPPVGTTWKLQSQWLRQYDEVDAINQPALFLHRGPQVATQNHAYGVTKWQWRATIWVYFRTDGYRTVNTYPDQLTDKFLDDLEQTFQTEPFAGRLSFGEVAYQCYIDGTIFSDPGLTDGQAVIIVPLTIIV